VRYLGLEFGVNSHRPTPPGTVFERRFGDCKDKTYLLCAVLQALDIEAAPALVHTGYRARVAERLPSPYAFDHVVARVRLGDREAWVDPTRSHQRGPLSARWFPDFGRALIVDASTVALTTIPPATKGLPKTTVQETFTIRGPKDAVEMRIVTTTEGADAETMRAMLASSPLDEISRSYLNFYARHYPRIEVSQELRVIDTPESNILKIFEQYRIEEFWSLSDDERAFTADFYPWTLAAVVAGPSTHRRSMPLAIAHPLRQSVRTEVKLPELWPVVEEPVTFATPAGRTSIRRRMTGTTLSMEFDHVSLASEIGVAEVPEYLDTLERIDESFGYQLTWQNPDGPAALFQPNWSILMLAAFCLVLLAIGAALTYRWQPAVATPALASNETTPARPRLEGLGGWLVFVALGLFLTPITAASFFVQTYAVYSTEQWNALTVPGTETYHAYWAPYLIFALVGNLTSLVLALLLLVLFFGKRRSFPRIYIGFLIFQTLAMAIDFVGARQLSALLEESDLVESTNDLVRSVGACAIWIPYMVVSRRVRSTFVR
jgi:hypothetical protein